MLGALINSLETPAVAIGLMEALDAPALKERLLAAAEKADMDPADFMAEMVRDFLNASSADHWVQLIGIMNRAEDPGLAAMRAILDKVLPKANEIERASPPE